MKKFLILNLLFIAASLNASGGTAPAAPGTPRTTESEETSGDYLGAPGKVDESSGGQNTYTLEGILYPAFKAFSPDGKKIYTIKITGENNDQIRIWNSLNGVLINALDVDEKIRRLEWNPNSNELIIGGTTKSTLWKLPN